jgi:HlyD family secretion protein
MSKRCWILAALLLALALAGCSRAPTPTPTPIPALSTPESQVFLTASGVSASGVIVPKQKAQLSFAQNGQVKLVTVASGEDVDANQEIAQLHGIENLEAAVSAAEMDLLSAQQALDALKENASVTRAQAFVAIAEAYDEVRNAKYQLYYYLTPSDQAGLEVVQAMDLSEDKLEEARQAFDAYRQKSEFDDTRRDLKEKLDSAESDNRSTLRRLELEAELMIAEAKLEKAKQDYEKVKDGPNPSDVAMAEARLNHAKAQLKVAQAALEQAVLRAPFAGTVTAVEVSPGETVLPGKVVVILGDLSQLQVETSDLSERDVGKVQVGQEARVYVEALNEEVEGRVVEISPQATTVGGDVVYTVIIELNEQPQGLRWGMSAEVEIVTE